MRRNEQTIESELLEILGIQDDTLKLERIVAWCAVYPNEIPFALRFLRGRMASSEDNADVDVEV
jgi:hypothetical protein